MDTVTFDRPETGVADDDPLGDRMPRRPRRQFLNRRSAALAALLTCAVGFYAGARVEKGQVSSTPRTFALGGGTGAATSVTGRRAGGGAAGAGATGAAGAPGAASAAGATGAAGTAGATGAGAAGAGAAGAGAAGAGGFAARGGAGGGSFGTVQSVNGDTLVLAEASGDTVKVRLASSTKVTKTESVKRSAVRPGDTVVVAGAPNSKGTLVAATLTDAGSAGASRTGSASSGSSGSGGGVSSLFSGGGG